MATMRKPTPEVSARMKLVKTKSTKPEIETSRVLRKLRVRFRRNVRSLPGTPDFVLPDHNVAGEGDAQQATRPPQGSTATVAGLPRRATVGTRPRRACRSTNQYGDPLRQRPHAVALPPEDNKVKGIPRLSSGRKRCGGRHSRSAASRRSASDYIPVLASDHDRAISRHFA